MDMERGFEPKTLRKPRSVEPAKAAVSNINAISLQQEQKPLWLIRFVLALVSFACAFFWGVSNLHAALPTDANPEELAAAQGMEAMVIGHMFEQMRKTVPESELMPKSQGERIYQSLLDYEYAQAASRTGSFGIAELVLAEIQGKR